MMARDVLGAEPFGQMHRQALTQPPGVYEHQRRAVLRNQLGDAGIELLPHLRRHHRLERRGRNLQSEIEGPDVSGVVTRMWGGRLSIACRSDCGVSPVRTNVRTSMSGSPCSANVARISASGSDRFFWTSFDSALSGET